MPASEVSVCNLALIKLGADRISALSQDTKSAVLLNAIFDDTRDEVLVAHPWNFAIKRVALTPNANTPVYEYDYEYDLPSDCLKVLEEEYDRIYEDPDWVVENGKILSDEETIEISYIYRHEDPSSWPPAFVEALSWRLAEKIAYSLTQSLEREKTAGDKFKTELTNARYADGSEGIIKNLIADQWTNARK